MPPKKANRSDPEVKVRAFPKGGRRHAGGASSTWMLALAGVALASAGVLGALQSEFVPGLSGVLASLAEAGVGNGELLVCGVVALAAAVLAGSQCSHARRILDDEETAGAIVELGTDMAEFSNRMVEFQDDHLHFRTELGAVRADLRDWRQHQENDKGSSDALYRLAASLDQLGARLDKRLGEAMGSLHEQVDEVTQLVEASRDFLQETLEESNGEVQSIAREMQGLSGEVQSISSELVGLGSKVRTLGERAYQVPAESPEGLPSPVLDHDEDEDPGDLLVSVDLEDDDHEESHLGLLDEIDDVVYDEYEYDDEHDEYESAEGERGDGQSQHPADEGATEAAAAAADSGAPADAQERPAPALEQLRPPLPMDAEVPADGPHVNDAGPPAANAPVTLGEPLQPPAPLPAPPSERSASAPHGPAPPYTPPSDGHTTTGTDGLTEVNLDGLAPTSIPRERGMQMPEVPRDPPAPGCAAPPPWPSGM
jgi:hypothetical protein